MRKFIIAVIVCVLPALPANAYDELVRLWEGCDLYTSQSAAQAQENSSHGCGFTGARWILDRRAHQDWCTRGWSKKFIQPPGVLAAETQARTEALQKCRGCVQYAADGVEQNDSNNRRNCGGIGPRWHSDRGTHLRWCIGANAWDLQGEKSARQALLNQCR